MVAVSGRFGSGSRLQDCHGYLPAVPELLGSPRQPVGHQFPSSSIGDELKLRTKNDFSSICYHLPCYYFLVGKGGGGGAGGQ